MTSTVPAVPAVLALSYKDWPAGRPLHRIHAHIYDALTFNPGTVGNARFSPIVDQAGNAIPTMYAGATFDCAAVETVFHDIAFTPGLKTVSESKFVGQDRSVLVPVSDLHLVLLTSIALNKLDLKRHELIDTEAITYPQTRLWAEAIHAQAPTAQGLWWVSRQDDTADAVMLFGDRIPPGGLSQQAPSRDVIGTNSDRLAIYDLAERMGVLVVP